ncbi:uncharacterized protein LOC100900716 [Galendromus occidentalis]|uniref:Uncharacterized protein LOC100900716 n=1 Tax=Galendromus occidentalis TaxID=34638 RepID=A0AAJ6QNK0_9ACAR|nr:uncharacterized protein LOC100900716 [Galendromus occidentalis]
MGFCQPKLRLILSIFLLAGLASANIIKDARLCDVSPSENEIAKESERSRKAQVNVDPAGYTLSHVVILSRHSIRAPQRIDNKLIKTESFPLGLGYSTKIGNRFSVKVGKIWREFYGDFVKNTNIRQTWIRSSSYIRCAETQQLALGQMLPPDDEFSFGHPTQPIIAIKLPIGNDVNVETCDVPAPQSLPELDELTDPALTSDGFSTFGEFVKFVTDKTGYLPNETAYFEPIIDGIYCSKYNQLPIPRWAEEKWRSLDFAMRKLSHDYWINEIPYYGNYIGKFLASRLSTFANGPYQHRFSFLSYHDTSIQAVLKALGNDPVELYPGFLAALHFQVYRRDSDGELFVRAMYHQGATPELEYRDAEEIRIEACPFPSCTLKDLASKLSHIYDDVDRSPCSRIDFTALL